MKACVVGGLLCFFVFFLMPCWSWLETIVFSTGQHWLCLKWQPVGLPDTAMAPALLIFM